MKRYTGVELPLLLAALALIVALLVPTNGGAASKAVFVKPVANPTNTPQPNGKQMGIPFVSPQPACTGALSGSYRDANGCIYDCAGGKVTVRTRPLSNACAYPTTGATLTPTPTVTATP